MEDEIIAGAVVSIVTGLVRKVKAMGEAGIVITLAIAAGIVGALWWASQSWQLMEVIYTAVKAVVLTIAAAIGLYESSKQKGKSDDGDGTNNGTPVPEPSTVGSGAPAGAGAGDSSGRIAIPQLIDRDDSTGNLAR